MIDEELFRRGVSCLQAAGIPFWVDFGTLLGLVRDGRLIPWDLDYDFGLWSHQTTERAVIDAFDPSEFRVQSLFSRGITTIHVFPKAKVEGKLDLTFYTKKADRAVYLTHVAAKSGWTRLLASAERFLDSSIEGDTPLKLGVERLFHRVFLPLVPRVARREFGRGFESLVVRNIRRGPCYVYDFPAHYFEQFQTVSFLGVDVNIPQKVEEYLDKAYGLDWRVPREWVNWYDGATRIEHSEIRPRRGSDVVNRRSVQA